MLTRKVQGWLGSPGTPAPQIALAAFGKHPGWDDHIEDLGLETEGLIQARRVLYSEGVAGNIESGAWEQLEPAQRLAEFRHLVVWRRGWDLIIARLWSSSDGKGRTHYPMVLCVHCTAIPLAWAVKEVLPRIEKAQTRCEETPRASDVREIVHATRLKLRTALNASLKELGSWSQEEVASDRELARLAESPQLQVYPAPGTPPPPARAGLLRIMYQLEREFAAFAAGGNKDRRSAMVSARAQQIRVPSCGVPPGEAGRLWTGVLLETLADGVDIVTVQSLDQRWLDIIVGEPKTANLFCMRASERMIPLTSDVPYTLDAEFLARAQVTIDAWNGLAPKPGTGAHAAPPAEAAPVAPGPASPAPPAPPAPAGPAGFADQTLADLPPTVAESAPVVITPEPRPVMPTPPPGHGFELPRSRPEDNRPIGQPERALSVWMLLLVALVVVVAAVIVFMAVRGGEPEPLPEPLPISAQPGRPPLPPALPSDAAGPGVSGVIPSEPAPKGEPVTAERPMPPIPPPPGAPEKGVVEPARPVIVTAESVDRAIRAGVDLSQPIAPGGPSLQEAAARLEGAAGGSAASVARLIAIRSGLDRGELERVIEGAGSSSAFEAFAAWRRLTELGWPDRAGEFGGFDEARVRVLSLAEGIEDGARRPALRAELSASARRAALAGLEVCGAASEAEWAGVLEVARAAGVSRAELGPVARFNTVLMELRVDLARGGPEGEAARRVEAFLAQVEGFDGKVRGRVTALVAALKTAMQAGDSGGAPDALRMGPAQAGWRAARAEGELATVVFEAPRGPGGGKPDRLEFTAIPGTGVYMMRDEVPAGLAVREISRRGGWPDVRKARLLRMFEPAVNDPRPGPRTWDWSAQKAGEAEPARQWLWPGPSESRLKVRSEPPPDGVPMQHVSVDGMVYLAGLLGCRLPTLEEWERARAAEAGSPGGPANLRDAAWKRQWEAVRGLQGSPAAPPWPDRGAFKPRDMVVPTDERAKPATEEDDGVIWFLPAGEGPGRLFRNLVGNVAEVVVLDAGALAGIEPGRAEGIDQKLGDRSGVRVIGGSALSAAELGVDRAWPVERTPSREGWADVGFRLVFSAAAEARPGVWARAREAAAVGGYLGRE